MNRGFAISRIVVFVLVFTIATISLCFAQFAGGTGTVASPYQVATAAQLNIVRSYPAAHFVQTANIDLGIAPYNAGAGWTPIATQTAPFTGTYLGNGFKILNLFINRPVTNYQGLFAYTSNAEIQQLVLENARVTGKDYTAALLGCGLNTVILKSSASGTIAGAALVGGLIGSLEGGSTITESYANCTTSGQTSIGGLIGNSKGSSHANACYSAGQVNGTNAIGGLIGTQGASVSSYCYSAAVVTGSWAVGGLLGLNDTASQINYCYAYGLVSGTSSVGGLVGRSVQSQTTSSYWNTQTSTQTSSAGGVGSSTDDMNYPYAASTFVGWDFSGLWREDLASTVNGGYPYLSWQYTPPPQLYVPQNLSVTYSPGDDWLNLAWDAPLNGNPVSYNVYRNGVLLHSVAFTSFEDMYLEHGRSYSYTVTAVYSSGESAATEAVSVTVYKRPQPALYVNPADGAVQVNFQPEFVWTPDPLEGFPQPDGYEFLLWTDDEPTVLSTVFLAGQTSFAILDVLLPETQYFWKLTPYISTPDRNGDNSLGLNSLAETRERNVLYAQNCPVWSFTTKAAIALSLTPASWDFGDVLISTSVFQDFSVANIGAYDAIISSVYLTGDSLSAFSLDTATPPISIEPMGSLSVRVYFNPLYAGIQSVSLVLVDSDGDLHSIPISGIGFAEAVGRPINLTANLDGWTNVALNWEMDYTERTQMDTSKSDLALNSTAETNQRSLQYFNIYRNAELLTTSTEPYYYDADLQDGWYEYNVTAVFQTFMSEPSNTASIEIFTNLPPQNLSAALVDEAVQLNWAASLAGFETGYNIWRLQPGQEDNEANWTLLIENTTEPSWMDNTWSDLPSGSYRWAVKAMYAGEVFSIPALSNVLVKEILYPVISVSPGFIECSLSAADSLQIQLVINNNGAAELIWDSTITFIPTKQNRLMFVSLSPSSGSIMPDSSQVCYLNINPAEATLGINYFELEISSNDTENHFITVPITIEVTAPLAYIPDDNFRMAINEALEQEPEYLPTIADLNSFTGSLGFANKNISSIEGAQYFVNLSQLDLEGNQISDLSPLSGLTSLNSVVLATNLITDLNPLSSLTYLYIMDVRNNQVSNISSLAGFAHLGQLALGNNLITNISPLSGLVSLLSLSLESNQITDFSPLSGLINLQQINLGLNSITSISPLSGLSSLQAIYLSGNQISDLSPLSGLANLQYLELMNNQIINCSPLSDLTNLQNLELSNNQISDLHPLSGLANLQILALRNNLISDLSPLSGLANLQYLWLSDNNISDIIPLSGFTTLTGLYLDNNPLSKESMLLSQSWSLPYVTYIFNALAPCYPEPERNATNVPIYSGITWQGNYDSPIADYEVFLGNSPDSLFYWGDGYAMGESYYASETNLQPLTNYYWRVKAIADTVQIWSGMWSFTTGEPVYNPPLNVVAINDTVNAYISWDSPEYSSNPTDYQVWSMQAGQENNEANWVLVSETTSNNTATDPQWKYLSAGSYKWAVKAVYTGGVLSEASFSNTLEKGTFPRNLVVVEIGEGTWCQYCPGAAMGSEDLVSNEHQVAIIVNHNGDSYANSYSNARNTYYGIVAFPTASFDGLNSYAGGSYTQSLYSTYLPRVNSRLSVPSRYDISATGSIYGNEISISARVTKTVENTDENLVLHCVFTESNIPLNWQGQNHVSYVNRLMAPDQNGTPVNLALIDSIEVSLQATWDSSWNRENGEVIFFLQNTVTKEIMQGAKYPLSAFTILNYDPPRSVVAQINDPNAQLTWQAPLAGKPVSYQIWRLLPGQETEEASWTLVSGAGSDTTATDPQWAYVAEGSYKWAVKAIYTGSVLSSPAFSNSLEKTMPTEAMIAVNPEIIEETITTNGVFQTAITLQNLGNAPLEWTSSLDVRAVNRGANANAPRVSAELRAEHRGGDLPIPTAFAERYKSSSAARGNREIATPGSTPSSIPNRNFALYLEPNSGSIQPDSLLVCTLNIDSSDSPNGLYTYQLVIASNAVNSPELIIPISINVSGGTPAYIPDDNFRMAINEALGQATDYQPTIEDLQGIYGTLDADSRNIVYIEGAQHLINLQGLDLGYNQISDLSPLSTLTNLQYLDLIDNQISDISPLSLLTNLQQLYLFFNQISDISPLSLLVNLQLLDLGPNQISDISPLSELTNLQQLYLESNQISDLSPLSSLSSLYFLYLSGNQISDLSPLSLLTNLQYLNLWDNQISDLSPLVGLENLYTLYLDGNPLSKESMLLTQSWDLPYIASTFTALSPCYPEPMRNAMDVAVESGLAWQGNYDSQTALFEVYMGDSPQNLSYIGDGYMVEDAYYSIETNLQPLTQYYWRIKAVADPDTVWSGMWSFTTNQAGSTLTIGEGISNLQIPINPFWVYTYSQSIFLQSEIDIADQRIEKVGYYWNGAAEATVSNNWTIYMGHTANAEFASTSSWIPLANLTQVFQGEVALPATAGWIEIPLSTPFMYNNTDNLVIAVDENEANYDASQGYFFSTGTATYRSITFISDETNPDPNTPPSGMRVLGYPNVLLQIINIPVGAPDPVTLITPEDDATGLSIDGFDLTWAPALTGGIPETYAFYMAQTIDSLETSSHYWDGITDSFFDPTQAVLDPITYQYGETWYWSVKAFNSGGVVSNPATPFSFTISEETPEFAGGSGTEADPYLVATAEHLNNVRIYPTAHFIQVANINLGVEPWTLNEGWDPIGSITSFRGTYDGDGYTIDGLYINRPDVTNQGLFGHCGSATLKHLNLTNLYVSCHSFSGGLVGELSSSCTIDSCYSSGSVTSSGSSQCLGGLVGATGTDNTITNSHSSCTVSGFNAVGGLVGYTVISSISNSYSTGTVTGTSNYIGGLVGYNHSNSIISNCFSSSVVSGYSSVGGLVGSLNNTSSITNSYSRGSVTGTTNVGGLVGYNYESTVITSYWDTQTSGQSSSAGGGGRLSADMTSPYASNTYVGWDFATTWAEDSDYYVSGGYPYLQWQSAIPGLAAPGNLTAYYDPEFEATYLSWYAVVNAESYHIYGSLTELDPSFVLLGNSYETGYGDNSGSLVYMVTAVNGSVESEPSNYAYINRMQPVQVSLSIDTTHSNAVLTWQRMREADAYEVYYAEDPYALFPSGWTGPTVITDNNYIEPLAAQRFYRVLARIPQRNITRPNAGKSGK